MWCIRCTRPKLSATQFFPCLQRKVYGYAGDLDASVFVETKFPGNKFPVGIVQNLRLSCRNFALIKSAGFL